VRGIRYASVDLVGDIVQLSVFNSEDLGSLEFLDLYEFGPLDCSLELGDADEVSAFPTLEACIAEMRARWPQREIRLVNEGMVQEEYRDYIAGGRRD
jgi:hypothetical protein